MQFKKHKRYKLHGELATRYGKKTFIAGGVMGSTVFDLKNNFVCYGHEHVLCTELPDKKPFKIGATYQLITRNGFAATACINSTYGYGVFKFTVGSIDEDGDVRDDNGDLIAYAVERVYFRRVDNK